MAAQTIPPASIYGHDFLDAVIVFRAYRVPMRTLFSSLQKAFQARAWQAPNGFTLLEMMIALAIFGLAALALIRLTGYTTVQTARLDDRLAEEIVAQNLAAELLTDPRPPSLGSATGERSNMGMRFAWTRTISADAQANIVRIRLEVGRSDLLRGEERPPFTMEIIRQAAQ
jgi:general secretion pathway protein I